MSYLDTLAANRSGGTESAASARSRFRKRGPKGSRKVGSLTKPTKRAKLRVKRVATKPPGKESRGTTKKTPSEKAKMAKKSKRSKKRRSAAQRAATRKMLAANKAKRSGGRRKSSGKRKARKAGKRRARKSSGRKSAKRVAAGKKAARTRKRHKAERAGAARKGKRKSRKSGKRRSAKRKTRRSSKRRTKRTAVKVVRLPRKASRVVVVSAPAKPRRRRARKAGKRKSRRRSPKRYAGFTGKRLYNRRGKAAMENPMDGTELFIGAVTGLAGFLTADVLDRFLATHALTAASVATGATVATYTDTPPTTGDYAGLFNATAICAPMNATRWLAGLGVASVPLIIAHFVSAPKGRAALQFFGYAAGIRVVGKGLIDAVAMLTQPTQLGQQLYDGEMRAAALKTGSGTMPANVTLPSAGLGRARLGAGKPCAPCASKQTGAGYPSAPREITAQSQSTPQPPSGQPTPPPPAATTPATSTATPPAPPAGPNQLFGTRANGGRLPRRDPNWGYKGDAE